MNALQETPKQQVAITIPSYSDASGKISGSNGGWTVSAHIDLTPGAAPRHVLAVLPLVYDDQTKSAVVRSFPFTLPAGTTSARVEYLATGHGGATADFDCIGPADEFCRRTHSLNADGAAFLAKKVLWRDDCDKLCTTTTGGPFKSYCLENPCGSPDSVRASRANWCPGSETPPLVFEPAQLAPRRSRRRSADRHDRRRCLLEALAQGLRVRRLISDRRYPVTLLRGRADLLPRRHAVERVGNRSARLERIDDIVNPEMLGGGE